MEEKIINHENTYELSKLVKSDEQLLKVVEYLKENNETIKKIECYDSRSGWHGVNIWLQGRDLSLNGYCYDVRNLIDHIDKFNEYKKDLGSEEYNLYLKLKNKYKKIDRFFNN